LYAAQWEETKANAHMLALHASRLCLFYGKKKKKNLFGFYLFVQKCILYIMRFPEISQGVRMFV